MTERGISQARKVALRSQMLHRIGAVMVAQNGFTLGSGFNTTDAGNPLRSAWSTHAEVACLRSTLRKYRPGSYGRWTMYIARINNRGEEMLAAPCARCRRILAAFNIRVVYSPFGEG